MKPLNYDNSPCSPISSNCVIWQGPNLDCIKLCTGDTVSDVVAKLATELCTIMDQLNISNYDLSCFDLVGCKPDTYQAFLQFLIDQVCNLNNIVGSQSSNNSGSTKEDPLITVAPCFVVNGVTVMTLTQYVIAIGLRVCNIVDQIADIQTQIDNLQIQVNSLEVIVNEGNTYTLPSIPTNCFEDSIGSTSATIDLVLNALINDPLISYCQLLASTGTPAEITSAVLSQCILNTSPSLANPGDMQTAYPNWITNPITAADTLNNLWIALCDMYNYVSTLTLNVEDTNTVNLTFASGVLTAAVQDTGWRCLEGFDTYMNTNAGTQYSFPQVRRIGNVLHFRGNVVVPLAESSGALRPWINTTSQNNYEKEPSGGLPVTLKTPYQGTGGVVAISFGALQFNRNGAGVAQSVIPTTVIPAGYQIDGLYAHPERYIMSTRVIQLKSATGNTDTDTSSILSTLFSLSINQNGILTIGLIKNAEQSNVNANMYFSTSHLNYIISHVTQDEFVPKFDFASNIIYSKVTPAGTSDLNLNFPDYRYPFSCNANDEEQVGGFVFKLDGLTAFIGPCGAKIATPVLDSFACAGTCPP